MSEQSKALRYAEELYRYGTVIDHRGCAEELLQLYAENEKLKASQYGSGRLQALREECAAKDALLKQALEALENASDLFTIPEDLQERLLSTDVDLVDEAIDAIRLHLEKS